MVMTTPRGCCEPLYGSAPGNASLPGSRFEVRGLTFEVCGANVDVRQQMPTTVTSSPQTSNLQPLTCVLRMCLILAIVEVVFTSLPSRRSVYGDQSQEISREVRQEHVAQRG